MPAPSVKQTAPLPSLHDQSVERERQLQRALIAYIVTGLFFMLLPGTFLGVWNLVSISSRHTLESLSPAWLQAHGHAQIFGWIGTFILGIGFYSLSKMEKLPPFAVWRAWAALALWAAGTALRWIAGVSEWQWRVLRPVSALLELSGFLIFFRTVSGHRAAGESSRRKPEAWMLMVVASTLGFLASLVLNAVGAFRVSWQGNGLALPHVFDQRLVALETWCFLAVAIWGINARWLPIFLGLREPDDELLLTALGLVWAAILAGFAGASMLSALLLPIAAVTALFAVRAWHKPVRAAKTTGVHPSFPCKEMPSWSTTNSTRVSLRGRTAASRQISSRRTTRSPLCESSSNAALQSQNFDGNWWVVYRRLPRNAPAKPTPTGTPTALQSSRRTTQLFPGVAGRVGRAPR